MQDQNHNYGTAIREAFFYLLNNYEDVFVMGQGLWSPWYVGNSMTNLDKEFGVERVIDTPVSESACTGAAVGASLAGMKPIVVHPRMDFMLYAMDAIVNEAAKWSHMTGGQGHPSLTIRSIINRGGEQGAQHSQALHNWFAHVPGLRVVMPSSVADARDLLIASVLSQDPVMYIDDRWLYEQEDILKPVEELDLNDITPLVVTKGEDITLVASSFSTLVAKRSQQMLINEGIKPEIIDLRVINPMNYDLILDSVKKTGRLAVIDSGWTSSGFSSEIITSVVEKLNPEIFKSSPIRIALPDAPAPTSRFLEKNYYFDEKDVVEKIKSLFNS